MKKALYAIMIVLVPMIFNAQLKIIEPDSTTNLDGQTLQAKGNAADFELVKDLYVVNTGSNSLVLRVIRTEVDVLSGTENATCWQLCPNFVTAGSQPVLVSALTETIAPGDTAKSFAAHYKPKNIDGCSLMKYEWVEDSNQSVSLASVSIKFLHTLGVCTVGIEENENTTFSMYPNPASSDVVIDFGTKTNNSVELVVSDLLGRNIDRKIVGKDVSRISLPVDDYTEGAYFVSILSEGRLMKTSKLIVRH